MCPMRRYGVSAHQPGAVRGARDTAVAGVLSVGMRSVPAQDVSPHRRPQGHETTAGYLELAVFAFIGGNGGKKAVKTSLG